MYLSGGVPLGSGSGGRFRSLQEKINDFWIKLSKEYKFDWKTIKDVTGKDYTAPEMNSNLIYGRIGTKIKF
jgi:hypothetical protein